jgi:DNA-directed RNA polymerase specialized sigma subunit
MTKRGDAMPSSAGGAEGCDGGELDELRAAAAGDRAARERILARHLHLVEAAVGVRRAESLAASDLYQEGTVGLLRAIDGFAASGRPEFTAYAQQQIALHMDLALAAENASIREAKDLVEAAEAFERAEQEVRRARKGTGSTAPTDKEIAAKLGWTEARTAEVREMVAAARRRHDEELLAYVDPEDVDPDELRRMLDERGSG